MPGRPSPQTLSHRRPLRNLGMVARKTLTPTLSHRERGQEPPQLRCDSEALCKGLHQASGHPRPRRDHQARATHAGRRHDHAGVVPEPRFRPARQDAQGIGRQYAERLCRREGMIDAHYAARQAPREHVRSRWFIEDWSLRGTPLGTPWTRWATSGTSGPTNPIWAHVGQSERLNAPTR